MDEYISRQEAIKALYEVYEHDYPTASGDFDEYARHDVRNVLNGLPSADVQPVKHGRWIEKTDYNGDTYYDCSDCEESWTTIEGTPSENGMNYCPNCGARMEGDSDD